jgi:hypothetical protein
VELRYSDHAVDQMIARGITEQMVEAVLLSPQWMPATTRSTRDDAIVGGRRVGVVVAEQHDPPVVVTVMWADAGE